MQNNYLGMEFDLTKHFIIFFLNQHRNLPEQHGIIHPIPIPIPTLAVSSGIHQVYPNIAILLQLLRIQQMMTLHHPLTAFYRSYMTFPVDTHCQALHMNPPSIYLIAHLSHNPHRIQMYCQSIHLLAPQFQNPHTVCTLSNSPYESTFDSFTGPSLLWPALNESLVHSITSYPVPEPTHNEVHVAHESAISTICHDCGCSRGLIKQARYICTLENSLVDS